MENFNITLELIKKVEEKKASREEKNPEEGYYVLRLNQVCDCSLQTALTKMV